MTVTFTRGSFAALPVFLLPFWQACPAHAAVAGPQLSIEKKEKPEVVVSWFGEKAVSYQLQTSGDLHFWGNIGLPITGGGSLVKVTIPIVGKPRAFFRLKPDVITAVFTPATGVLTVIGDDFDNEIFISRNAAGNLIVNGGAVSITNAPATVANTVRIDILGHGGDDQLALIETNGALPAARLFGEGGNDTLSGGSGADLLDGGTGNDSLSGKGGTDNLIGGDGDDTLTGGDADDQVSGGNNNDRLIWNPGDDTDLNEGDGDIDTIEVNGGNGAEVFTVTANGVRVRFDRIDPAPFSLDIGSAEKLVLNANGGNDQFSATGNLAALIQITVDGGSGADTILGSNGIDTLLGGDDADFIDGNQGNDTLLTGDGDDVCQWDPGDGNDTVEGGQGQDTLRFNGSAASEIYVVAANGGRIMFTRNIANIVMDLNDVETLDLNSLGGTDILTVENVSGTDLGTVIADLAIVGGAADGAADSVFLNGSNADDVITTTLSPGVLEVAGLSTKVLVSGYDPALDLVRIQALAGEDVIDASAVPAGGPQLALDGGTGNDILLGSADVDTLAGGDNDDVLIGGGGVDVLDDGAGENILIQSGPNPGAGIVSVFGDAGDNAITISRNAAGQILSNGVPIPGATVANTPLVRVFGRGGNDTLSVSETNGALPAAFLFGSAGNDTLTSGSGADLLFGGGGNDTVLGKGGSDLLFGGAGNDSLTGGDADDQAFGEADTDRFIWNPGDDTDLNEAGSGTDTIEVNGGNGAEVFAATANGTRVRFDRIDPAPFSLDIGSAEHLVLSANGGDDQFSATGNLAALIQISVDGGTGADTLLGSNGNDTLIGGNDADFMDGNQGNDTILMGSGDDVCQWDPGDGNDTVEGQEGSDTLLFNGSAGSEVFAVSANGGRILFTRNIANIVMDLSDVETLDLNLLGGIDSLTLNDLTGTDLINVIADLAGTIGGGAGDAGVDSIVLNGTQGPDAISFTASGSAVTVTGLAATLRILQPELANDHVTANGLGGTDIFTVGPGVTGLIGVTTNP